MPDAVLCPDKAQLRWLYTQLFKHYGALHWWPAETRFEVVIGAVLVQNTAWGNVEQAIANLHTRQWTTAADLLAAPEVALKAAIRPCGYFNLKTQRLLNLCQWWQDQGGFAMLDDMTTHSLRQGLLSVNGVGPETADDILLYAFNRPVFVIDAYTRRLLQRLGWLATDPGYEALRRVFEATLPQDAALFGQYHALIVEHAKQHCRKKPQCTGCPVSSRCEYVQELKV